MNPTAQTEKNSSNFLITPKKFGNPSKIKIMMELN